jgi:tetratricopeptide (TPR) repeat protein
VKSRSFSALAVLAALTMAASNGGCRPAAPPPDAGTQLAESDSAGVAREDMFKTAIDNLNHLEDFASDEMLVQVVDRLNQWAEVQQPLPGWKPDPLLNGLPQALRDLSAVKDLDKLHFVPEDALFLHAAVCLRDLSAWARGPTHGEVEQAGRLFDWTVRNIQVDPPATGPDGQPAERLRQLPWETLLFGRGTSLDRAWVFILLARQQGIEAAMLALADPADPSGGRLRPWAVAVLSGGELYLFDPALGLPIPAPGGVRLGKDGQLVVEPATLRQVAADASLLRKLDLDPRYVYAAGAENLKRTMALVDASPADLSMRMRLVESRLAGPEKMVLTAPASDQAKRLTAVPGIGGAALWTFPYATILQRTRLSKEPAFAQQQMLALVPFFRLDPSRPLWKGRIYHLKGKLGGEHGATFFYQKARPPTGEIDAAAAGGKLDPLARAMFLRAKQDASFWLGLVSFELGNYHAAEDYFTKRTLEAAPGGPWTHGAKYNLGRTYEASRQYDLAIREYEGDVQSPGYHGNALRARWLRALRAGQREEKPAAKTESKPARGT